MNWAIAAHTGVPSAKRSRELASACTAMAAPVTSATER